MPSWLAPRWKSQKSCLLELAEIAFLDSSDMTPGVNIINKKASVNEAGGSGGHSESPSKALKRFRLQKACTLA